MIANFFREFAYGLKLGARHCVSVRGDFTSHVMTASVKAKTQNKPIANEQFGR